MAEPSLELLQSLMQRQIDAQGRFEERLARIEAVLADVRDDVTVLTGAWMRDEGEKLAVATLLAKVKRSEQRLDELERRVSPAE